MAVFNEQNLMRSALVSAAAAYAQSRGGYSKAVTGNKYRSGGPGGQTMVITKRRRTNRAKSFKTLVYDTEPAKHYTFDGSTTLTHDTILTCMPTQGIGQGTGATQRVGDEVYLCAVKLHGLFVSAATAGAYKYRVIVAWTGEEYTTANIQNQFVAGLTKTEIFLPNTAATFSVNGIVNSKALTVISDQTVDINSQIAATSDWTTFTDTVQINQRFPYQSSGSVFGKSKNLVILVMSDVAGGTAGLTPSGQQVLSVDLIFK